jgi:hypothetical protein
MSHTSEPRTNAAIAVLLGIANSLMTPLDGCAPWLREAGRVGTAASDRGRLGAERRMVYTWISDYLACVLC